MSQHRIGRVFLVHLLILVWLWVGIFLLILCLYIIFSSFLMPGVGEFLVLYRALEEETGQ